METSSYKINWYDDPRDWSKSLTGKKYIYIDMSTRDILLLCKGTFFVNSGLMQAHGQYINHFAKHDFPILMEILDKVKKAISLLID